MTLEVVVIECFRDLDFVSAENNNVDFGVMFVVIKLVPNIWRFAQAFDKVDVVGYGCFACFFKFKNVMRMSEKKGS